MSKRFIGTVKSKNGKQFHVDYYPETGEIELSKNAIGARKKARTARNESDALNSAQEEVNRNDDFLDE